MGKSYEHTDYSNLLAELQGNTVKQATVQAGSRASVYAFGKAPIPEKTDIRYADSLRILNELFMAGFDESVDYLLHIEIAMELFQTIISKDTAYWKSIDDKLKVINSQEKNRIYNWLQDMKEAYENEDMEDFDFFKDRLSTASGFCTYATNYSQSPDVVDEPPVCKESEKLHRILSNEKIKYVYNERTNTIHDKSCSLVKQMSDSDICECEEYLSQYEPCKECEKKAYIRMGARDIKEYDKYVKLFELMGADINQIKRMYIALRFETKLSNMNIEESKYSAYDNNAITIWYREDTWRVGVTSKGKVRLEHNNYKVSKNGKREFTKGFHVQSDRFYSVQMKDVVDYIRDYRYEEHFVKQETQKKAVISVPEYDLSKNPSKDIKPSIRDRVVAFFRKTIFRDRIHFYNTNNVAPIKNQICLYMTIDDQGKEHWMTGRYLSKKGEFSMFQEGKCINTPLKDVKKWLPVDKLNAK